MGCDTNGVRSVLYWPDMFHQRRTLTIPHGRRDNVSTFRLVDGYDKFQSFCTEVGESMGSDDEPSVILSRVVSDQTDNFDDGEYSDQPSTDQMSPDEDLTGRIIEPSTGPAVKHSTDPNPEPTQIKPTTTEFDLDGESGSQDIIEEEQVKEVTRPDFLRVTGIPKPKTFQAIWVSGICLRPCSPSKAAVPQVEGASQSWYKTRTLPMPPKKCGTCIESDDGLVGPQFHVQYDRSFSTVNSLSSQLQYRAGFVTQREKTDDAANALTNTGFAKRAPPVGEGKSNGHPYQTGQ
jgi:hypothetical protein